MNIGIDIDGVLTNDDDYIIDCTSKFCYENNLDFFGNPYAYEYKKLSWDEDTINKYRDLYFDNYVDNEPVRKFACEVIKKLKEDGHKIFIITGRYKSHDDTQDGENMRQRIKSWLDKNEILYDKLIFARVPKTNEIKENKIDIMIEDSPTTIPIIKDFVDVLCYDTRYNKIIEYKNVTRVFSWYDIYRKINEKN